VNLALLIGHFPPGDFGGAELQAEAWAARLADRHRVTVITRRDPPTQPSREERDGFTVIRLEPSPVPFVRTALDIMAIRNATRALVPRPDVALCFQTFISGLAGITVQRHLGIPAVVWIRGEGEYRLAGSRRARWFGPRVWRAARGVLVQSEANRDGLLAALAGDAALRDAVAAKLEVVPNGLDLPAPPFARGSRVLVVGRLIRDKGVDTVVDAAADAGLALTVAGDGPERAALEARARARGRDARFLGFVPRAGLAALYADAACAVLAARAGEGLPNTLLEAFAHACPVVATPVAGVRDLIRDGVNGLLVPPDDVPALRAALDRLAREPGLGARLGAAARATAEGYAWSEVRPRLERALERWRAA
jgi:glycosyltransferase involved in cell wall biosynthesis